MGTLEVGLALVDMVSMGAETERQFVDKYYSEKIISIEGADSEEMPARMIGIEAVKGKHDWWYENNEVHGTSVEGPFIGLQKDQFAVKFTMDHTPKGGARTQMQEIAFFTVKNDKIVQEEYLYLAG